MKYNPNDRVEHVNSEIKGTIISDDGYNVVVNWDDGQIGLLTRRNDVCYNANRLVKLVTKVNKDNDHSRTAS